MQIYDMYESDKQGIQNFDVKPQGSTPHVVSRSTCRDDIAMNLERIWQAVDCIYLWSSRLWHHVVW